MQNFVHLHLHTEYSLLDGACRIKDIPAAVKAAGQTAVAITDHGVMFGAVEFYKACKKEGVKPIIGCEVYVAKRTMYDKEHGIDSEMGHLVLLASNEVGYRNLLYLVSKAQTDGFYSKPRVDIPTLQAHAEGLIALSACMGGFVQQLILRGDMNGAREYALRMRDIFGEDNYFLELQDHGIDGQKAVNTGLNAISRQTGIELVVTNDVHYLHRSQADAQAVLMCIQTNTTVADGRPEAFDTDEFYLKTGDEMRALFPYHLHALENTCRIAERCNYDYDFSKIYLPAFKLPEGFSSASYLQKIAREGLEKRLVQLKIDGDGQKPYRERLEYELGQIITIGYAEYFLIVWDFIAYAKSKGIPVGPGRGSGAGSLAAYCMGITDVDPIHYQLYFERFLNPERVSMPDFDIDLCQDRRGEVIDYVTAKYGSDHVAQIITFGTMQARAAVRDTGRALGMTYNEVDAVARTIPRFMGYSLKDALRDSKELESMYSVDPQVRRLIDTAMLLEGMPRHASTHAAGVVVTDQPVWEHVPLAKNPDAVVTQFSMNAIADLGLLKIDFLGLRYLTIIDHAVRSIRRSHPDFTLDHISYDDPKVFAMLGSGQTDGVFQFEGTGVRGLLMNMKPECVEDLVAATSLYRPGPMESIGRYLENRADKTKIRYLTPELEPILNVTSGCIIYQEQVMQIFRALAGYSLGGADVVRRAMSKKKFAEMERERERFIYGDPSAGIRGCVPSGIAEDAAREIFRQMESFAAYAFNKSHAVAYATLSYKTAYLRCHYPREYLCELLSSVIYDTGKMNQYITECTRNRIRILPPDVNRSFAYFTAEEEGIRFGLLAIKNVGAGYINHIVKERQIRQFTSFDDYLERMSAYDTNKRQVEALIKCGVFDSFGKYRAQLLQVYIGAIDQLSQRRRKGYEGQMDLFGNAESSPGAYNSLVIDYPNVPELSQREMLEYEKEASGQYFSGHPLNEYSVHAQKLRAVSIGSVLASFGDEGTEEFYEKQVIAITGVVLESKVKVTRGGDEMCFATLEDMYGQIELITFPKVYRDNAGLLKPGKVIFVTGEISLRDEEAAKVLVRTLGLLKKNEDTAQPQPRVSYEGKSLYLKVGDMADQRFGVITRILKRYPVPREQANPVYILELVSSKRLQWTDISIRLTQDVLDDLRQILGDSCVVVK